MAQNTKLGQASAGASKEAPASRLAEAISKGARVGRDVELPRLGRAYCELVGARSAGAIDIAAMRAVQAQAEKEGLDVVADPTTLTMLIENERAVRSLAVAMRDPDDHSKQFGTAEEWGALDVRLVSACWEKYGDVEQEFDPFVATLTPEAKQMIDAALAKKNSMLLRSLGTATLVIYMLSMAEQQQISPTPKSESGAPSSEPST